MADVFRISVVLAIVYLARFILAHDRQTEEDRLYSFDFQRGDSSSAIEDSNENFPILSEESFRGRTIQKRVWYEEDDRDVESNEEVQILRDDPFRGSHTDWFEEEKIVESNEDYLSDENEPINFRIPPRKRTAWSKEDRYVESNEYNPLNEKVLIKSGVPLRVRTIPHTAWSEEKKIVESNRDNPSNEKVLIQSGVPLRGRKIHQTAWSEEEKIVESKEDVTQEHVEKSVYDSWSLTNAFNYILSFIYDVEDGEAIVQTTAGDTKQILKSRNEDFPEMVLPQSQNILDSQKKTSRNSASFQNQDTEWLESGSGDFDNGDEYFDFEFDETMFKDKDYDQEDDFVNQFEKEGALQGNPLKNIGLNLFEVKEKEMKVQETRNETKVENESTLSSENYVAEKQSKDNVNSTVYSNQKPKRDPNDNFARVEDKKSFENAETNNEVPKMSANGAGNSVVVTEQLSSKRNKETINVAQFQNSTSPKKPTKKNGAEHSKSKTNALRDLYPDFEVQENVASYNYMLDSDEFIRVDENGGNKVSKKQSISTLVPIKKEKQPLRDENNKPEIFGTILEYLYKNSNSSLLLSLREYNSSES